MTTTAKLETIYIDIDALLDTRLGVINQYNPDLASKVVSSGKYHKRDEDVFEGLSKEDFAALYKNRNKETLSHSVVTNIVYVLKKLVPAFVQQAINMPYHDGCKICINYYPYTLSDSELEAIRLSLDATLQQVVPIEFINLNDAFLTPSYCKDSFSMMFRYNYEEWFNAHATDFKTCRLPDVNLYAPAIYFNKKPTEAELKEAVNKSKHPMRALEILASPIISLRLLDAAVFSIISPQ